MAKPFTEVAAIFLEFFRSRVHSGSVTGTVIWSLRLCLGNGDRRERLVARQCDDASMLVFFTSSGWDPLAARKTTSTVVLRRPHKAARRLLNLPPTRLNDPAGQWTGFPNCDCGEGPGVLYR
jgi:hypothetical protein